MQPALPPWLHRAWLIRTCVLSLLFGVITLMSYGQLHPAAGASEGMPPFGQILRWMLGWMLAAALASGLDLVWLRRNHHRITPWGLSKGRSARNRPL